MTRTINTLACFMGALVAVGSLQAEASPFDVVSADTLEDNGWHVGIFAPLRYGITDDLEVSSHPISAFWNGNFALKKGWGEFGGWGVATRHGFSYPTRLLGAFARDGAGGILPLDAEIPHIIAADTRVLMSRGITDTTRFTLGARLTLAPAFGESSWGPLDMPLVYARTAAARNGAATNISVALDGRWNESFSWLSSTEAWYLPGSVGAWSVEQTIATAWSTKGGFSVQGGAIFVAGEYDYGTNWHVLPKFDMGWRF
jgi:hypothetical protein